MIIETMQKKLDLLALADGFKVEKNISDNCYEVYCKEAELMAVIDVKGNIEYYKDCCGYDSVQMIDMDNLLKLKAFCEALVK